MALSFCGHQHSLGNTPDTYPLAHVHGHQLAFNLDRTDYRALCMAVQERVCLRTIHLCWFLSCGGPIPASLSESSVGGYVVFPNQFETLNFQEVHFLALQFPQLCRICNFKKEKTVKGNK